MELEGAATYSCFIPGKPEPQGSARAYTYKRKAEKGGGVGARVDSDNAALKGWRRRAIVALQAARTPPRDKPLFTGAVQIDALFVIPRTLAHPKTTKGAPVGPHTVKPDLDKLVRALNDALTQAGILEDDSLDVRGHSEKRYAYLGEAPGVHVWVRPLCEEPPSAR